MSGFKIISSLDKWDGFSDVMFITDRGVCVATATEVRQVLAEYRQFVNTHALVLQETHNENAVEYELLWQDSQEAK